MGLFNRLLGISDPIPYRAPPAPHVVTVRVGESSEEFFSDDPPERQQLYIDIAHRREAKRLWDLEHPIMSYSKTHGPWDMANLRCMRCGLSDLDIEASRKRCMPERDPNYIARFDGSCPWQC